MITPSWYRLAWHTACLDLTLSSHILRSPRRQSAPPSSFPSPCQTCFLASTLQSLDFGIVVLASFLASLRLHLLRLYLLRCSAVIVASVLDDSCLLSWPCFILFLLLRDKGLVGVRIRGVISIAPSRAGFLVGAVVVVIVFL